MKVLNPGDWAREALQIRFSNKDEYDKFKTGLALAKMRVGELGAVNGSSLTAYYLLIEGHQTLVYVDNEENSFQMPDREAFLQTLDEEIYDKLLEVAVKRNMNVQKLIRYVVIPEWMKVQKK